MVTAIPPDRLRQIAERKPDDISVSFLEIFDADSYKDPEGVVVTKEFISESEIKLRQEKPFESDTYTIYTVSAKFHEYGSQSDVSPTHCEPALRAAIPARSAIKLEDSSFPASLWNEVRQIETWGRRDKALDLMFREIDLLLRRGEFEKCNQLLERLDVSKHSTNLLLGYLAITFSADEKLPARPHLLRRVEEKLSGHPHRERLLTGLRKRAHEPHSS